MTSPPSITSVGEILVDFVSTRAGTTLSKAPGFTKHAGGAAANVAVGLAKLGVRTAFIGRVGRDPFGHFLASELRKNGVNTARVRIDDSHRTRLAFVSRTRSGGRDFVFWGSSPADEQLQRSDVDFARLSRSSIIHIGSFLLLKDPARSTAFHIAEKASRLGSIVSFDPNLRLSLWRSAREARRNLLRMVRHTSVLRLNSEEAYFLTGSRRYRRAGAKLLAEGPNLVAITLGARGCYACTKLHSVFVRGFKVAVVDTTGCGDGFLAALLFGSLAGRNQIRNFSASTLESICRFANAAGALTAMRPGVISALPSRRQVERFLASRKTRA
ncbi:MAG TPA: carbohydrate kinase [Bacteroidota bacterium]|nr:carbohydrate kinase [Bacteroidota bacterium]